MCDRIQQRKHQFFEAHSPDHSLDNLKLEMESIEEKQAKETAEIVERAPRRLNANFSFVDLYNSTS